MSSHVPSHLFTYLFNIFLKQLHQHYSVAGRLDVKIRFNGCPPQPGVLRQVFRAKVSLYCFYHTAGDHRASCNKEGKGLQRDADSFVLYSKYERIVMAGSAVWIEVKNEAKLKQDGDEN